MQDGPTAQTAVPAAPDSGRGIWTSLATYAAIGVLLRILLAAVNTEANDDHIVVMREILARDGAHPGREVCWECYHAKLYHYAGAAAYALTGLPAARSAAYVANFVAGAAGLGLLALLLRCARSGLGSLGWRPSTRLLGGAFFMLWPALIVICSQATNDAFVVLFSSLALFFLRRFLEGQRYRDAAWTTAFMILAVSSKASGWIFFGLAMAIVAVKMAVHTGAARRRMLVFAAAAGAAFLPAASLQEPYRGYIRDYGTPFKGALEEENARQPLPHLFRQTQYASPGVLSIADAFFTFRFVDMMAHPYISNLHPAFPRHRTCFWSQLYGRAFFTRFDQWPPSWQTLDAFTLNVGRACLLLGLLPAACLLVGAGRALRAVAAGLRREGPGFLARDHDWIFPFFVLAFLGMVAMFAVLYRGYSWMKVIYLLPCLLGLFKMYLDGLETLSSRFPALEKPMLYGHLLLFLAFNIDVVRLIGQLWAQRQAWS